MTSSLTALITVGMTLFADVARSTQLPSAEDSANEPDAIEAVTVTARRRAEQAQGVPISIVALSGTELEDRGVTNLRDMSSISPGLFTFSGSQRGNSAATFSIRGQAQRSISPGDDPSIGIYFAELPWARAEGVNADLLDMESVQVLKGPQGTLFGRNSTGGAILLTPRAPTNDFQGYVQATTGDYGRVGGEGVLNLPLVDHVLALRLGAQYLKRDGYMRMVNTGAMLSDVDNLSLRAALQWSPTDAIKSTFIWSQFRQSDGGVGNKLIGISPQPISGSVVNTTYPYIQQYLALTQDLGKYEGYSSYVPDIIVTVPGLTAQLLNKQFTRVDTDTIQNTTTWELGGLGFLGDVSLKNIAGYRDVVSENTFDNANLPVLINRTIPGSAVRQVSDELQVLGSNGAFEYVAGLFAFREESGAQTLGFNSIGLAQLVNFTAIADDNRYKNVAKSAFVHASYDLSRHVLSGLSVSGGVRFNKDERHLTARSTRQSRATGLWSCTLGTPVVATASSDPAACAMNFDASFSEPTWDAGLNYQFTQDNMLYGSVSHGYRSGGVQVGASLAASIPYSPEFVDNYEIGSKNDFAIAGAPARLNLSVFYSDYTDIQRNINRLIDGRTITSRTNAAKATIQGGELEFKLRPSRHLDIGLNYAYLNASYGEFTDQVSSRGVLYPVDVSDSIFTFLSRHSVSANVSYELPVDPSFGDITIVGAYSYKTKFITQQDINTNHCSSAADPNNPPALYTQCWNRDPLPGYGVANLRINWRQIMGSRVDASLFVDNVTDRFYYAWSSLSYPTQQTNVAQPGPPRMFGVDLRVSFGGGTN